MEDPDYRSLAINPTQYDSDELNWDTETAVSPTRKFFARYLEEALGDITGKSLIDIGSGTGYLTPIYLQHGAAEVFGIEPSTSNVAISQKMNPEMKVMQISLENLEPLRIYDVATSVMVFEHIEDPQAALNKIYKLLAPGGRFIFITGDLDTARTPRFDYELDVQDLGNQEIAARTKRPQGVMYDLFRPIENYLRYAEAAGFELIARTPMVPTPELMQAEPKYAEFQGKPLAHVIVLSRPN